MDLFEFTEMLRRQRIILIVGTVAIVVLVLLMGFDFDGGFGFRAKPRYESSIQMAVVPADFDSLAATFPDAGAMQRNAALYATLLASPEAAAEISEESGIQLLDRLAVATSRDDGSLGVTAAAQHEEDAKQVALYAFTWLGRRLADSPNIVRVGQSDAKPPSTSILDESGQFEGTINVSASPAFSDTAADLWVAFTTADSVVTVSLADAAGETFEYPALLQPDSDMVVSLQDVFGNQLDALTVRIPPLPEPDSVPYTLEILLGRGLILYSPALTQDDTGDGPTVTSEPELLESHVDVAWQRVPSPVDLVEGSSAVPVGLILLTEEPVATATGTRRGPVIVLAALVAGFFGLLLVVVAADTWSSARHRATGDQPGKDVPGEPVMIEIAQPVGKKERGSG